jgi:hypothetical protein
MLRILLTTTIGVLALSTLPAHARSVGVAAAVNQAARSVQPAGAVRTLSLGDNVIFNERIETDSGGLLQVLLADGTTFTVGPGSSLVIDRFVYDPDANTAQMAATVTKGVFRFIGGRTSKTPDGARIDTPVGTIGIRGGGVDFSVGHSGSGNNLTGNFWFGDRVTITDKNGKTKEIYEPGYSFTVQQGQGGTQTQVTKTPPGAGNQIQQALTGARGTHGGSPNQPTEETVEISGIAQDNSAHSPEIANPPIPQPRPFDEAEVDSQTAAAGQDLVREEIIGSPPPTPPAPAPDDQPVTTSSTLRVMTAGSSYQTFRTINNPGSVGLIGGSAAHDERVSAEISQDGSTATLSTAQGALVLPVYSDANFATHVIGAGDGYSLAGQALSGKIYSGADDFAAYVLSIGGDPTKPVFALTGTPISDPSVLATSDVRTYSFTPDLLQDVAVPFVRGDAFANGYTNAAVTDFYVIEPASLAQDSPHLFQSWLMIDGAGAAQVSGIGVTVGDIYEDNGVLQFGSGRRGGIRTSSNEFVSSFFGGIKSLGEGSGGNTIYGVNGQNMVLATDFTINDAFNDRAGDFGSDAVFGSTHVLNLTDETPVADFAANGGTSRDLASTGTIRGFAAGIQEDVLAAGGAILFPSTSGADPDNVYLAFDGASNRMGSEIRVDSPYSHLDTAFGDGVRGNNAYGASAYVDDVYFGAQENNDKTRFHLRKTDINGQTTADYYPIQDTRTNSYLVSGDAVPQPNLLPGGKLCDCEFLKWGWWGTQLNMSTNPNATNEDVRASVHLGTWVAGDISRDLDLPVAGTASYEGNALGNVSSNGTAYVASGAMNLNWDFGARSGNMSVTNFDGRDFSGTLNAPAPNGGDAVFTGSLVQSNMDASGPVNGAFVGSGGDSAAGVIGNFNLSGANTNWTAVGIIGGSLSGI